LHQNVEALRGRTVKLYQDNQAVCGALRKKGNPRSQFEGRNAANGGPSS
jgi:hypothetical protein